MLRWDEFLDGNGKFLLVMWDAPIALWDFVFPELDEEHERPEVRCAAGIAHFGTAVLLACVSPSFSLVLFLSSGAHEVVAKEIATKERLRVVVLRRFFFRAETSCIF